MKNYRIIAFVLLYMVLVGCNKDDDMRGIVSNPSLTVTPDKTTIEPGETITFTINHDAESLVVYNGEDGYVYRYSLAYLTSGLSEAELNSDTNYKVENPESYVYKYSYDILDAGNLSGGWYMQDNANTVTTSDNYANKEDSNRYEETSSQPLMAWIELDETIDKHCMVVQNDMDRSYMNYFVRFYPRIELTSNKTVTFTMRNESTKIVSDKSTTPYTYVWASESNQVQFYFRLKCKLKDGVDSDGEAITYGAYSEYYWADNPSSNGTTAWKCTYTPSTEYQQVECDLSQHIDNWCVLQGVDEDDIDYLEYIEFNIKGQSNTTNLLDTPIYISDIQYSGVSYFDYNYGESIEISNPNGLETYSHTYYDSGDYEVTFVATTNSLKNNYSYFTNTTSSDYSFGMTYVTIPIRVSNVDDSSDTSGSSSSSIVDLSDTTGSDSGSVDDMNVNDITD